MGTLEVDSELDRPPEERQPRPSTTAPLEPSFYQIGMRMADTQWAMNYQEAAIYLEEGANNDQFSTHPKRRESLPAYILAHTSWFYILDLLASLVLLFLALAEEPAVEAFEMPIGIHASLELSALAVITIGLILKLRWLGIKTIFTHHRTLLKALALAVMIVEATVVLYRQTSHFRVTRALRPIFLMDNRYCRGVRRFTRQVLQSLPPILDMLLLLFFFILIFTLLGHFLFKNDPADPFFRTLGMSFVNLFVLLTTANYPDVMMPQYYRNRWAALFFIAYLVTVLYLFMNLLLAVVYDVFTSLEKEKFRKLVIHKRKACHFAFNLLISKSNTNGIIFRHFYGMMTQYKPNKSLRDIYLTFRALDRSGDGILSREEFCRFYEVADLKWKSVISVTGFQAQWPYFKEIGVTAQRFLTSPYANHLFNGVIVLNTVAMAARWIDGGGPHGSWDSYIFAIWFLFEMCMKIATWGYIRVFSSGWHSFDLVASVAFFFTMLLVQFIPSWDEILTFIRPLRLLRLFKLKKRYRDVFGTIFILIPPMSSAASVILILYYFFAIIGMELFSDYNLVNCCNGTFLQPYYADDGSNTTLHYFLNTYSNILASFVTLFELTVVNNWYVIMEGHAYVTNDFSRIYFMTFYLVTMVLLTIIVAFILDTFLFRIQYKRAMDKNTEEKMLRTEVWLTGEEIDFCYRQYCQDHRKRMQLLQDYGEDLAAKGYVVYVGYRRRTKEILFKRMFRNEIPDWLRETEPIIGI
ncbi:Two pore calcium channel protein 1 [Orchesella cincta]|uniref:Two pore calcium channel protein 1 n=1 Tax=Orchesella cincta TaxID=48709 RepID=A0A1D2N356_ORCCI|nr:Two pore calcium channel protein 1 [Orchesella cincta]